MQETFPGQIDLRPEAHFKKNIKSPHLNELGQQITEKEFKEQRAKRRSGDTEEWRERQ